MELDRGKWYAYNAGDTNAMETSKFDRRGAEDDDGEYWGGRTDHIIRGESADTGNAKSLKEKSNVRGSAELLSNAFAPAHHNSIPAADTLRSRRREWPEQWSAEQPPLSKDRNVNLNYPSHGWRPKRARTNIRPQQTRGIFERMGLFLIIIAWLSVPVSAVLISFENCLSDAMQNDLPLQLQIVPKFFDAVFDTTDPKHNLKVTAYFNVDGSWARAYPPPSNDTEYWRGNQTDKGGKIVNILFPDAQKPIATTAFDRVDVLTYRTWSQNKFFCTELKDSTCPVGPKFNINE